MICARSCGFRPLQASRPTSNASTPSSPARSWPSSSTTTPSGLTRARGSGGLWTSTSPTPTWSLSHEGQRSSSPRPGPLRPAQRSAPGARRRSSGAAAATLSTEGRGTPAEHYRATHGVGESSFRAQHARAFEEAVASFKDQGRRVEAARAMTTLANVLWFRGDARNREVAAEAVALLESEPPGPELVEAYAEAGRLDTLAGDHREGIGWAERALALASDLGLGVVQSPRRASARDRITPASRPPAQSPGSRTASRSTARSSGSERRPGPRPLARGRSNPTSEAGRAQVPARSR